MLWFTNKQQDSDLCLINNNWDLWIANTTMVRVRSDTVGWGTALQAGRSRVWFPMVSLEFFIDIILLAALWPWGCHFNRNEYHEYFLGGKGGRRVGLTTFLPSCANCLEIWEPQPPVQAFTFLYNSHWTWRLLNNNYIKHIFWIFIKVLVVQSCFPCCSRKPWFNYTSYLSHSSGVIRLAVGEWMLG